MITKCWPGWYRVDIPMYDCHVLEREKWCKEHIGFSDHDTWVYQRAHIRVPGHFSFKDEKWAMMFLLRWCNA